MSIKLVFPRRELRKAVKEVRTADKTLERQMREGTRDVALIAQKAIVRGIRRQRTGWPPLRPFTVKKKAKAGLDPRMLIATGDMVNFLDSPQAILKVPNGHIVGIPEGATNGRGESLADIAALHENGGLVTFKGKTVVVPARPFIGPVASEINRQARAIMAGRVRRGADLMVRRIKGR